MPRLILIMFTCLFPLTAYCQWTTTLQWSEKYNGPPAWNSTDAGRFLCLTPDSALYACGYSSNGNNYDIVLIKYTLTGDTLWIRRYNNPLDTDDVPLTVLTDTASNCYILSSESGPGVSRFRILNYDDSGILQWTTVADSMWENSNNLPLKCMALDHSGHIIIGGSVFNTTQDYRTIRYNASGNLLWKRVFASSGLGADKLTTLITDAAGNVYVSGSSWNGSNYDYLTLKYDSVGTLMWQAVWNGPGNSTDYPYSMALDSLGNLYVSGECYMGSPPANTGFGTVKYNASGAFQWEAFYNAPDSLSDRAQIIRCISGFIYVGGTSYRSSPSLGGSGNDFCLVKYDMSGNQLWWAGFNGSGNDDDILYSMDVTSDGDVVMAGDIYSSDHSRSMGLVCYSPSGNELWRTEYDSAAMEQKAFGLACGANNSIYVCGIDNYNMRTMRYNATIVTATGMASQEKPRVFPNPSCGEQLHVVLPGDDQDLKHALISDLSGKEFVVRYSRTMEGVYILNPAQLSPGYYLLSLKCRNTYTLPLLILPGRK